MAIILLGHSVIRTFKNPEGEDFDRYQLRIHEKAGNYLKGWVDVLGYCEHEGGVGKLGKSDAKPKGYSTGVRMARFERTAAYDAKTRLTLPSSLELRSEDPWALLAEALAATRATTAPELRARIRAVTKELGDRDLQKRVSARSKAPATTPLSFLDS